MNQQPSNDAWRMGRFKGLFGWSPQNDLYANVTDFISTKVAASPDVEIEARLGKLVISNGDSDSDLSRQGLPVETMCQVNREKMHTNVRFESGVPHEKMRHLNKVFNNWTNNSKNPPPQNKQFFPDITYKRTKEIDRFYSIEDSKQRIRETICSETGIVKATIIKEKMGSIEIHMPKTAFDFRISASLEKPVPQVEKGRHPDCIRKKDRISYEFECFSIDVTTISTWDGPTPACAEDIMQKSGEQQHSPSSRTYEVEIEIRDVKFLRHHRKLFATRQQNCFQQLCTVFFNHCVHLSHTAHQTQLPSLCIPPRDTTRKRQQPKKDPHSLPPGHYRPAKRAKKDEEKKKD